MGGAVQPFEDRVQREAYRVARLRIAREVHHLEARCRGRTDRAAIR